MISREELAKHSDGENDCWTAIDDIVYDITRYIPVHPGGKKTALKGAGNDSTKIFYRMHKGIKPL